MGSVDKDSNKIKSHWVGYQITSIWIKNFEYCSLLYCWNKWNTSYLLWISTNLVVRGTKLQQSQDPLTRSLYGLPPVWLEVLCGLAHAHEAFRTAGPVRVWHPSMETWKWMQKKGKDYYPVLIVPCSGLLYLPNYGWQLYENRNSCHTSYLEESCFSTLK